jgi:hypothetical protein
LYGCASPTFRATIKINVAAMYFMMGKSAVGLIDRLTVIV